MEYFSRLPNATTRLGFGWVSDHMEKEKNHALSGYRNLMMQPAKLYLVYAECSIPFMVV